MLKIGDLVELDFAAINANSIYVRHAVKDAKFLTVVEGEHTTEWGSRNVWVKNRKGDLYHLVTKILKKVKPKMRFIFT